MPHTLEEGKERLRPIQIRCGDIFISNDGNYCIIYNAGLDESKMPIQYQNNDIFFAGVVHDYNTPNERFGMGGTTDRNNYGKHVAHWGIKRMIKAYKRFFSQTAPEELDYMIQMLKHNYNLTKRKPRTLLK